jgi:tetratricopeptide (TPR) repeat protein
MQFLKRTLALSVGLQLLLSAPVHAGKKAEPWKASVDSARQQITAGQYDLARQTLQTAVQQTAAFPTNDPRLAQVNQLYGQMYLAQQDYLQAKDYFERSLPGLQVGFGPESLEVADSLYGLSVCAQQQAPLSAEVWLKRVVQIWSNKYGSTDQRLAKILPVLASTAVMASDYGYAQKTYQQLVGVQEKNFGSNSPQFGQALTLLSQSQANLGNLNLAEENAKKAVTALRESGGSSIALDAAKENLRYIQQQLDTPYTGDEGALPGEPSGNWESKAKPISLESAIAKAVDEKKPPKSKQKPDDDGGDEGTLKTVPVENKDITRPADENKDIPRPPVEDKNIPRPPVEDKNIKRPPVEDKNIKRPPVEKKDIPRPPEGGSTLPQEDGKNPDAVASANLPSSSASHIVRPPSIESQASSPNEFHPWQLTSGKTLIGHASITGGASNPKNWGRIQYLSGGKLITEEEYKAMLLANQAYELIREEKYKLAVELLNKALSICNTLPSAHTNIGLALIQTGDQTQAIDHLKDAIALDATKSAPWVNLASAFQMSGQLRESVATYKEFVRRFPQDGLAAKAKDLADHLADEASNQAMVEKVAGLKDAIDYFAYATKQKPIRWSSKQPLKVYISNGSGVKGYKSEFAGSLKGAFNTWSSASDGSVKFVFVPSEAGADIDCRWSHNPEEAASLSEGGVAKVSWRGGNIEHCTITIMTCDPSPDAPLTDNQVNAVCLHEVGHSLGLMGHSPKPTDIMFCSMPSGGAKPMLSQRDIGTLKKLYSSDVIVGLRGD